MLVKDTLLMKTVIFYATPAHGHINPTLYFVRKLVEKQWRVIYYATDEFKEKIINAGAEYVEYDPHETGKIKIDIEKGSEFLKLYRIFLEATLHITDSLVGQAKQYKPDLIIHDTQATWGRRAAEILKVPAVSFNTFAIMKNIFNPSFWAYTKVGENVFDFFNHINEIPKINELKNKLRKKYHFRKIGIISTVMNREKLNIMSFSRKFQPGEKTFGDDYFFLGPVQICRREEFFDDLRNLPEKLILASLGTVTKDRTFIDMLFENLGNTEYTIVLSKGNVEVEPETVPDNFIIKDYVNQIRILQKAKLFITTGGLNSINEAIKFNVPCLIYPTQGEKQMMAQAVKKMGFGDIIYDFRNIKKQIDTVLKKYENWNYKLAEELTEIHMEELLLKLDEYSTPKS